MNGVGSDTAASAAQVLHRVLHSESTRSQTEGSEVRAPRLWALVGATGTGKTGLSLTLASQLAARGIGSEIINADAMQVYRGMDIGTAKLPPGDRRGIPHHLFDVLEVTEESTVAWYQPEARRTIAQIAARGNDAILVGGSGLYVSSVIFDFQFPPRDEQLRSSLEDRLEREGPASLLAELASLDPQAHATIDQRNPRRIVRALEIALLGGSAVTHLPESPQRWWPHTTVLGTHVERPTLVEGLDRRVERMWQEGLIDEARELMTRGLEQGKTASQAIGYQQAIQQIRGECSEAEAIASTQLATRRYARRQVSWFKRYAEVQWCTVDSEEDTA